MAETRPAPYPADTRARGWRFELDYEQIEQSDTWDLAAEIPMAQHALLMMWMVAWAQVPCGSLPQDEAVIRAKCRIPPAIWKKCRDVLMRGWWPAEDGRLYHDTLVKRAMEMMSRRRSDSDRQAAKRARDAAESGVTHATVTRDTAVTPPEVTPESSTDNRLPNTDTDTNTPPSPPRKRGGSRGQKSCPEQFVVTPEMQSWAAREVPGVDIERETAKFRDHEFSSAKTDWAKTWRNWMRRALERGGSSPDIFPRRAPPMQSFAERDREAGMQRWEEMTGRVHPDRQQQPGAVVVDLPPHQPLAIGGR